MNKYLGIIISLIAGLSTIIGYFSIYIKGDKSKIPYAVYLIDETEYSNMFPLEVMFQNKIYREDREAKLILNN